MTLAFTVLILAALAVQIWRRLTEAQRQAVEGVVMSLARSARALAQNARNKLFRRRLAYQSLFLSERGKLNDAGQIVMADLTRFCRGMTSITFAQTADGHTDMFRTGVAEGRREVLLYIMKELNLDLSQLMQNATIERQIEDVLAA